MTPDFKLIQHLAGWAARAYDQWNVSDALTDGQALVTLDGDMLIVAFRGSSSLKDFIIDARFLKTRLLWGWGFGPAEVHSGFLAQFESLAVEVTTKVRNCLAVAPNAKLYVLGHSLGGSLAILFGLECHRQSIPLAVVVTFGQPRVGNQRFADLYNAALKEITWCVVNAGDPVPLLPPLLNGYRDCGTEVFLTSGGDVSVDPFIGFELFTDLLGIVRSWRNRQLGMIPHHFMSAYQSQLSAVEIITSHA